MSASTIANQALARETFAQQAALADANAPAGPLRGAAIFSTKSKRVYTPGATEDRFFEAAGTSLPPVIRVDAASLMRVSRQLESIAKQQGPRIAFKAKGSILLLNLSDILAVEAEGNYVSLPKPEKKSRMLTQTTSGLPNKLKRRF